MARPTSRTDAVVAAAAAVSVACSYPLIRIYIIKLDWRPGQFPRENDLLQRGVVCLDVRPLYRKVLFNDSKKFKLKLDNGGTSPIFEHPSNYYY